MRYTVRKSVVDVVGYIWMPNRTCAMRYTLDGYQLRTLQEGCEDPFKPTREEVEQWLACHSGDFREVTDWSASLEIGPHTLDYPWGTEEGELAYEDCMWPAED